ncbi:helix-turn-helix transcriptional regulator [Trinickia violacea]|uniref:Helix-turn-helix transcriptional regulator n=1 Tax=Trinickia violacea TaxID=2571746 RepID=A0A4P8IJG1_9BURK|nr:helix-turn-helix transcriptional regulator [Trinickia violacea]QCP48326.1 helix-turn-helix transcriptional regulator [Trinickia violacea]
MSNYEISSFDSMSDIEITLAIGDRVRAERIRQNKSQLEFARVAGIPLRTYQRFERDGSGTIETLVAALRACERLRGLQVALPQPTLPERQTPLSRLTPPRVRRKLKLEGEDDVDR